MFVRPAALVVEAICTALENCFGQRDHDLKQLEIDAAQRLYDECLKLKVKNKELFDTTGKKIEELEAIIAGVQQFRDRQVFNSS